MISGGKFFNMVRSTVFKNLYFGNALSFIYMLFFFTVFIVYFYVSLCFLHLIHYVFYISKYYSLLLFKVYV